MLKMLQGIGWLLLSGALWAVEPPPPPLAAGVENVTMTPIWGLVETICLATEGVLLEAKLDTGADTSSLDARDIQAFDREGEPWVRFRIEGLRDDRAVTQLVERPVERRVKVRSASGSDSRYVVRMRVMFGSQEYDEQFSLRDRRRMNYPVLIGSRTLKHLGAVDVNRMHTQMPRCQP